MGDHVFVQNQIGNHPRRWDKRGQVVEVLQNHQYRVRVDGSRLTTLNRRFLRLFVPYTAEKIPSLPAHAEENTSSSSRSFTPQIQHNGAPPIRIEESNQSPQINEEQSTLEQTNTPAIDDEIIREPQQPSLDAEPVV